MKSLRSFPKLISAVLLVCAASLAWSCSDDDTGDDTFIPTFTLPEQPVIKNNYASQNNNSKTAMETSVRVFFIRFIRGYC